MATRTYTVTCEWDSEVSVWYVSESNVPGLATEAATLEAMEPITYTRTFGRRAPGEQVN